MAPGSRQIALVARFVPPVGANLGLAGLALAVSGGGLFAAPLLIGSAPAVAAAWLTAFVLLAPLQWGLTHEAIHGHLLRLRTANRAAGGVLAALLGYSFEVVRFGHLTHHGENGHDFDRPDRAVLDGRGAVARGLLRHYGHSSGVST